jgi:putative FmdB family regulatory protein
MPLYEYRCSKCADVFEVLQKFADAPLTVHEGCGGSVERLISRSGFSLKGSGWYATDYARGGSSSQTKDSDSKKESDGDSSKASDAKAKTESKSTESKSESKSTESKSSETKTESKPKPASSTKTD